LDRLKAEAPGILNWALTAVPRLLARGRFDISDSVRDAVAQLKVRVNAARMFLAEKVGELRDAVVRSFARLWRKGDLVRRMEFDPADLRVTLFDRHDRPVPKQRLSAGEKQICAISLLGALAQVSGRPLPVVIDTPLGRLDRDHRTHLVERYFPHASHQGVILSTDTEIDQAYFQELAPAVSHMYHLGYDQTEARCVVEEGYFWSPDGKEVAGAAE
jgi:DNA sulfur modification protein DndD